MSGEFADLEVERMEARLAGLEVTNRELVRERDEAREQLEISNRTLKLAIEEIGSLRSQQRVNQQTIDDYIHTVDAWKAHMDIVLKACVVKQAALKEFYGVYESMRDCSIIGVARERFQAHQAAVDMKWTTS